jgi:hypothetical protein
MKTATFRSVYNIPALSRLGVWSYENSGTGRNIMTAKFTFSEPGEGRGGPGREPHHKAGTGIGAGAASHTVLNILLRAAELYTNDFSAH